MSGNILKKATLLFARSELDGILRDLIELGIIDVSEPMPVADDPELAGFLKDEVIDLGHCSASRSNITILGTVSSLYLTGWITAKSEKTLAEMASKYICAWEIEDPPPEELENVPIRLRRPKFLHRFYKGPAKLFSPLTYKAAPAEKPEPEDAPMD